MKKTIPILLLLSFAFITKMAHAESISERQARDIATHFMASHSMSPASLTTVKRASRLNATPGSDKAAYYVFNASRGFVIISGDDRAPAVLGYSDKDTFDPQNVPEAMQELLDSYSDQIESLCQGAEAAPQLMANKAISPLVTAIWSQNNPYNILLPFLPKGTHASAGCVAVAMAQVMHYWQWPPRPSKTIPSYTSSSLGIYMPALPVVDFNWSAMHNTYQTTDTVSDAANAVATLMLYCAQSIEMDFKESSSGATTTRCPWILTDYFDFQGGTRCLSRFNYSSQEWADIIYSELAAGRPVIYSASKATSGHAFVCDGYDGKGMFHINWGWNGSSNGYFLLNVLNPDIQGTGSANGAYGYVYSQAVIVGIEPGTGGYGNTEVTSAYVTLNDYRATRTTSSGSFAAWVSGRFYNYTSQPFAIRYGWGLFRGNQFVKIITSNYYNYLKPGSYMNVNNTQLLFGSSITSGTYRIMPVYSNNDGNDWLPCVGAERNYIEVTFNGNTCTFLGHGTAGELDYSINDITVEGTMHPNRPVDINVNLTNRGDASNHLLHMFVDGKFTASSFVGLEKGETADVPFSFVTSTTGDYTLSFSFNDDGTQPLGMKTITISPMPSANLSASIQTLNVTDASNKIITSDHFSVQLSVLNSSSSTYDEDISVKLYKNIYGNTGTLVQTMNKRVVIGPHQRVPITFDLDNVIDGWRYFVKSYYYSNGEQVSLAGTSTHTIIFPAPSVKGDVNNDGEVNIADVNLAIDIVLSGGQNARGDVNGDGEVNLADINAIIDIILESQ